MEGLKYISNGSLLDWLFKLYDRKIYSDAEMGEFLGVDLKTGKLTEKGFLDGLTPDTYIEAFVLMKDRGMVTKEVVRDNFQAMLKKFEKKDK